MFFTVSPVERNGVPKAGRVVDPTLQVELPPVGGLLDEHLRIADVPVRRRIACNVISFGPTHAAQNACNLHFSRALMRNRRC